MNNLRTWGLAGLAALGLVLVVAWMAGVFEDQVAPGLQPRPLSDSDVVWTVALQSLPVLEPVMGSVEAKQATLVSSRTLARIERIHVRAGDRITEGDLLIELEQSDLQARVAQAREQVNAISARLAEAERNLRRAIELQQRGLLATADREAAQANRDTLQAELDSAQQARKEAEAALSWASIRSPIDGRVVDRFAEPGDMASPGMRLLSLYNPMSLRAEAQVREHLALSLAVGQKLQVELPALSLEVEGSIEEIVPAAHPGSRSFQIKVRLPYDERLLPGMYARVAIPAGEERHLRVPEQLVAQVGQLYMARVLGPEGPERRFLRLGKRDDDGLVEVLAGLEEGDRILPLRAGCPALSEC